MEQIQLHKLLMLFFADPRLRRRKIREQIRSDLKKSVDGSGSGRDFYSPFWASAKRYVVGEGDLHDMIEYLVGRSSQRRKLYPMLRDGFLLWWNERRRWTNAPFQLGKSETGECQFPDLDVSVKVHNTMTVIDGLNVEHVIYPYLWPEPVFSDEISRLGLWLLMQALPRVNPKELRILDVMRGRTFSLDKTPLLGNEEAEFKRLLAEYRREREELRKEYD